MVSHSRLSCEMLNLHLALDELDRCPSEKRYTNQLSLMWTIDTYRRKLMTVPAPVAASATCGRDSSAEVDPDHRRMIFCNCPYTRKSVAFSAMAPTTGAGSPWLFASSAQENQWRVRSDSRDIALECPRSSMSVSDSQPAL